MNITQEEPADPRPSLPDPSGPAAPRPKRRPAAESTSNDTPKVSTGGSFQ